MRVYDITLKFQSVPRAYSLRQVFLKDRHIYGSSRLGILKENKSINNIELEIPELPTLVGVSNTILSNRQYELTNYFGNILNIITDRKIAESDFADNPKVAYFMSEGVSYSDYLPFGQVMPNRHHDDNQYRYGFNGMEKDNEIKGDGNSYTSDFRQLDPRIGRWLSPDPVTKHSLSPYNSMSNNPILNIDPKGNDDYKVNKNGDISLKRKTKSKDDKLIGERNGLKRNKIHVEKGVLDHVESGTHTYDKGTGDERTAKYDVLTTYGEGKGKELFEFLADNTDVEFSHITIGKGAMQTGYISTSHDKHAEAGASELLANPLIQASDVQGFSHSHPGGISKPSGASSDPNNPDEKEGRHGDVKTAKYIETKFANKVVLSIYTNTDGQYHTYDSSTYKPNEIPEVIISRPKQK